MTGTVISGTRRIGGADLELRAARAARGLATLGIGEGDAVALLLRNDIAFFEATMAVGHLGAYPVPVNWHYSPTEAAYVLQDCGATVVICHADLYPIIADILPQGVQVLIVAVPPELRDAYHIDAQAAEPPAGLPLWDSWVEGYPAHDAPPRPAPASMIYTSGTTGHPKGVRRQPPTPEMTAASLKMRKFIYGYQPGMRALLTGPLYHSAPNMYGTFTLKFDGTLYLMPRFDAEQTLAMIAHEKITHVHMVPTMFVRLLKLPQEVRTGYDLSRIVRVNHGAAPCPPEIKRQMIEWWGPVLGEYYGGTETGTVVFCDSEQWLAHPGTVGRPVEGGHVRIYDAEGHVLPDGEIGEIFVRLDSFPDFTYQGREADRAECERDGLVSCGDIGYLDTDGFLYLCDRKRDMVISGGVNIYPAEIEAVLINCPGVHDCAVFGIPDAEFGESLMAAIECEPGTPLSEDTLRDWLDGQVTRFKIPRHFTFHDKLPREDSGKIFKRKLRDPYWEGTGRSI